ncbi:MAG: GGDEF domain-containing protein [Thermoanaerobaculia bacterium]|nr:GGDEF domain-containing protein [Thermoanaerobaculia bacterium]
MLALAFGVATLQLATPPVALLPGPLLVSSVLAVLALLAVVLRQGRTLLIAGVLAWTYRVGVPSEVWTAALSPILLGLVVLSPRHPFQRRNAATLVVLCGVGWLFAQPSLAAATSRLFEGWSGTIALSQFGFGLGAFGFLVLLLLRPSPLARGGLWSLPLLYLHEFPGAIESTWQPLTLPAALVLWIVASLGEAHALSFRDGLTRLPGRRAFDRELAELGRRFVIAMVDIDHFKRVNDRHGHDVGDQVLAKVASHLAGVRGGHAYRYGGEEFAVIFRGRRKDDCEKRLEELRRRISAAPFGVRGAKAKLKVTVSIGAAERTSEHSRPEDVLAAADKALYRAKRAGRNRVQLAA